MKYIRVTAFFIGALFQLCSCMSTRVYVKTQEHMQEDDIPTAEKSAVYRDGYEQQSASKNFYDLFDAFALVSETDESIVSKSFIAEKDSSSKSPYETITFSFVECTLTKKTNAFTSRVLGKKTVRVKNGAVVPYTDGNGRSSFAKGDTFSADVEDAFKTLPAKVIALSATSAASADTAANMHVEKLEEKVIVESTPNSNFIVYSIIGKPFVIVGSASWNVLRCAGYAFVNFLGGYNAVTGTVSGAPLWYLPSYSKSKAKAQKAKEANKIQHYPQYHLPFTNNHIIVTTVKSETDAAFTDQAQVRITDKTVAEYDTELSVARSAKADAASTMAVASLIGTVVTIPVSVVTWIGGAVFGVYAQTKN